MALLEGVPQLDALALVGEEEPRQGGPAERTGGHCGSARVVNGDEGGATVVGDDGGR